MFQSSLPGDRVVAYASGDGGPVPPSPSLTAATRNSYDVLGSKLFRMIEAPRVSIEEPVVLLVTYTVYPTTGGSPLSVSAFQAVHPKVTAVEPTSRMFGGLLRTGKTRK